MQVYFSGIFNSALDDVVDLRAKDMPNTINQRGNG